MSHLVWYLEAMDEVGANSAPARDLVGVLTSGTPLMDALRESALPPAARAFGEATARLLHRPLHARAAAFFHGREEVIPEMFVAILDRLERRGLHCDTLREYLQRHVEVDGSDHGPQAERMLARLCNGDPALRCEAEKAALESLAARERLWDAIVVAAAGLRSAAGA
jgi:hypothetical protein